MIERKFEIKSEEELKQHECPGNVLRWTDVRDKEWFENDVRKNYYLKSRRVEKFVSESNTFHIKSKAITVLSCKNFATLHDPPLWYYYVHAGRDRGFVQDRKVMLEKQSR